MLLWRGTSRLSTLFTCMPCFELLKCHMSLLLLHKRAEFTPLNCLESLCFPLTLLSRTANLFFLDLKMSQTSSSG